MIWTNEKWNGMRWGEWIIVKNGADLECLPKLNTLMTTYSWTLVKMNPTEKCMYESGEMRWYEMTMKWKRPNPQSIVVSN